MVRLVRLQTAGNVPHQILFLTQCKNGWLWTVAHLFHHWCVPARRSSRNLNGGFFLRVVKSIRKCHAPSDELFQPSSISSLSATTVSTFLHTEFISLFSDAILFVSSSCLSIESGEGFHKAGGGVPAKQQDRSRPPGHPSFPSPRSQLLHRRCPHWDEVPFLAAAQFRQQWEYQMGCLPFFSGSDHILAPPPFFLSWKRLREKYTLYFWVDWRAVGGGQPERQTKNIIFVVPSLCVPSKSSNLIFITLSLTQS